MRTRFSFVIAASAVAVLLLAACGGAPVAAPAQSAEEAAPAVDQAAVPAGQYAEAPMLAEKVAAGELPPVDERLPASPLVIEPVEEVGQYGGTWRMVDSQNDNGWLRQTIWVEPLMKWKRDMTGMRPNLLEDFTWNDDATVLTMKLREGIKWSDGEPLTMNDLLFWWNDIILDPAAGQSPPAGTAVGGEPMQVPPICC